MTEPIAGPGRAAVGMCFDRTFPAGLVVDFAQRLDHGADQLWLIEDCFFTGGVSLAAAAAAVTERLTVGIGILPVVARNPAVTAMEIATLCGLAPGRVLPGLGHGIQSWMGQMGVRTRSPLTTLDEVISTVTRLLAGERVTFHGREVHLEDVALAAPPEQAPPILAGVRGPKSLQLAGRVAGGVVLAEPAAPSYIRWSLEQADAPPDWHVAVFSVLCVRSDRREAYRTMAPWLAQQLVEPTIGLTTLDFFDDLVAWHAERGVEGLAEAPSEWWSELAPIGTLDDAAAHLDAVERAGAHSIGLFPSADVDIATAQLDDVLQLARR